MLTATTAASLALFAPVIVHDSAERHPLTGVDGTAPALYARATPAKEGGEWLQYWLYSPYQDQDRGIVRTGRHEGDWELAQYRVQGERLVEAVYAQHSGAERCPGSEVERRGGRPVVYAAHGSHASYFHPGVRDRTWPDPNDHADGRGQVVPAPVVAITRDNPPWMTKSTPWGNSRASRLIPPEQDSPLGPAFQRARWDANRFAADARACQAECITLDACDGREQAIASTAIVAVIGAAALTLRRARRRRPPGGARA